MYKIKSCAISDTGLKRQTNEDSYCESIQKDFFIIADGMGGCAYGELASKLAVTIIENFLTQAAKDENITWPFGLDTNLSLEANKLITAIRLANQNIYQNAQSHKDHQGMGTTVVAVLIKDDLASIANVGDSRAYRLRKAAIEQLTIDHSWVAEQVQKGFITKQEAKKHQLRNIITRALGINFEADIDLKTEKIEPNDYLILCSDGLSNMVDDETIKNTVLTAGDNLFLACKNLINLANEKGGKDNITVIVVYFESIFSDKIGTKYPVA